MKTMKEILRAKLFNEFNAAGCLVNELMIDSSGINVATKVEYIDSIKNTLRNVCPVLTRSFINVASLVNDGSVNIYFCK